MTEAIITLEFTLVSSSFTMTTLPPRRDTDTGLSDLEIDAVVGEFDEKGSPIVKPEKLAAQVQSKSIEAALSAFNQKNGMNVTAEEARKRILSILGNAIDGGQLPTGLKASNVQSTERIDCPAPDCETSLRSHRVEMTANGVKAEISHLLAHIIGNHPELKKPVVGTKLNARSKREDILSDGEKLLQVLFADELKQAKKTSAKKKPATKHAMSKAEGNAAARKKPKGRK